MTSEFIELGASKSVSQIGRLPLPAAVNLRRVYWPYVIVLVACHLLALLTVLPWFFSWTGVVLCILGDYFIGVFGINVCYHRLLTHRGFKCPKWFEHTLAILGVLCVQDTPARWVAIHRRHHQHADEQPDPHSPLVNFLWGHVGWLIFQNADLNLVGSFDRYAKDLMRDPFYRALERNFAYPLIIMASLLALYFGGFATELALGGSLADAMQFGLSLLVWGGFVRIVLVWHQTWAVNSVTHLWGYRNYQTDESSRNNLFVGIVSNGEGWHNNHHADPRSARHGHRWWEIDTTYLTIRLFAAIGLAHDVAIPGPHLAAACERLTTRVAQDNL